ncbi:hypothetical protein GNI_069090 [Gregarina niphandrodes]|uniref:Uncharacterized protein n=1 Tax=Gregarina niphandrodes TaxID=110365 RepID=A0A023B7K8_GRENI|nr:hypothetical protein GNI_069090 [Gregarina niphandrodes]EZG67377.1 hypothetical protein GNI_069090 [Gregarina niphandrodes]|eukprot:XP_011130258.1 hypothetical protein GNI_069090 [Gregarina niphandrodes]
MPGNRELASLLALDFCFIDRLLVDLFTGRSNIEVIGAIAGYSYYGEDMISVPESSIWMIALSLSLTLAITAASRKALLKWRELEELQWKTPCGPDVEACRSPVNDEDHQPVHANFECVLQVPDSMFNSEVPSDGTMIPVTLTLEEPRSSTPEMSAIREPIQYPRTSLTSPGPSASDFQSCKSNNAINPKRYSHGDKAAATPPRAAGQSKIASYFGQHLSPRPPWLLMPARPSEREVHSDHV